MLLHLLLLLLLLLRLLVPVPAMAVPVPVPVAPLLPLQQPLLLAIPTATPAVSALVPPVLVVLALGPRHRNHHLRRSLQILLVAHARKGVRVLRRLLDGIAAGAYQQLRAHCHSELWGSVQLEVLLLWEQP